MVAIKNLSEHNVPISGPDGKVHHTLPGDVFPKWAAAQVTNPIVVGDQRTDPDTRRARFDEDLAELRRKHGLDDTDSEVENERDAVGGDVYSEDEPDPNHVPGEPPARTGKGSGIDAWRDYAIDQDVEIEQDWTKDQIIAALDAAGKRT